MDEKSIAFLDGYNKGYEQGNRTGACEFANRIMQREDLSKEVSDAILAELEAIKEEQT